MTTAPAEALYASRTFRADLEDVLREDRQQGRRR